MSVSLVGSWSLVFDVCRSASGDDAGNDACLRGREAADEDRGGHDDGSQGSGDASGIVRCESHFVSLIC